MLREQTALYWRNWTRGEELDLASTYSGREALFSPESLGIVRAAREAAQERPELSDDVRALRAFELYIAGELISQATAELADAANELESTAELKIGRIQRPYRDLDRLLANEGSRNARARLQAAEVTVLEQLEPLLKARQELNARLAVELGFESYAHLGALLRDADLNELSALAERTLAATEALYTQSMDALTREVLGQPLSTTRRSDIPRLFRGSGLDDAFPADGLLAAAERTFSGLGIDPRDQPGLVLDLSAHPRKNPRAVCFPVDVPDDVRVSVKPIGGASDYRALLHELGHAQHFLQTRRPEWELRQLGNNTVAEAWAFLFDGLVDSPEWLADQGMDDESRTAHLRASATQRLYMLRRYAAKVLFEIQWHSGQLVGTPEEGYRQHLSRAYGFELSADDAKRYLIDHDEFFYSADYLRAWFLAAQLERHLEQRFGKRWWTSAEAGDYLPTLWREGNRLTPDELAQRIGEPGVNPEALARWLAARLHAVE